MSYLKNAEYILFAISDAIYYKKLETYLYYFMF